ncbi:hypothetical protein GY45DRAFT_380850 [Cubamyces sp. BRFM 1775]|nr:hypothetical protein GY45DRAFT_380850 [Cubamyces sp. BRFM 1775]
MPLPFSLLALSHIHFLHPTCQSSSAFLRSIHAQTTSIPPFHGSYLYSEPSSRPLRFITLHSSDGPVPLVPFVWFSRHMPSVIPPPSPPCR